ncbi:hypothetical protein SEVIR_6G174800v4 [Setaria viridis]|uniref:FLZ-type domain-containing protein n=2 Tax=Setaria TaxID=4554 RepID=K3YJU1_SETIT|nr:uncharacterized protein LOC101766833 [Setaria italica]XP_034598894.1 FCS-Like Zinc finger 15-like [Setaria viridis]RCV31338.1 hypothetical protein SETIT_6G169000v2 [Setaria italica]TKW10581.1 hypothetical protein SEVIR_6G174800v2 [Setaria viridis]
MLPRRQSIFHLGEEGGAAVHHHRVGVVGAAAMAGANGRRARERERLVVGLQILVHHQHHHHHHNQHHSHGRHAHAANIVLKQVVRPRSAAASRHGAVSCSFLKACSLCRRDLSPSKDVYMYRGDQGFCSEECRWEQILVDEARERQAAGSKERQRRGQAHHHSPHRTPNRGRPPPRKTLAVA